MGDLQVPRGMTLQVEVGDLDLARAFYGRLFGTGPEYEPHDDFLEWRAVRGAEVWLQVMTAEGEVRPLLNRVRFEVADVAAARAALLADGVDVSPVMALPHVVRFVDFDDPWGNRLGYYEDLAAGAPRPVGGSVHDESQFVVEPSAG